MSALCLFYQFLVIPCTAALRLGEGRGSTRIQALLHEPVLKVNLLSGGETRVKHADLAGRFLYFIVSWGCGIVHDLDSAMDVRTLLCCLEGLPGLQD